MKKLLSLVVLGALLAGCGTRPTTTLTAAPQVPAAAPSLSVAPALGLAPADAEKAPAAAAADRYQAVREPLQQIARHGALITGLDTLEPDPDESQAARAIQTTPAKTQEKADTLAHEWAPDAKQIWLGWGFKAISLFGNSRHVYFSESKKRLLTIDFGFWGTKKSQYETTGLVVQYAGKYIATVLNQPRDIYAVSGAEAYRLVRSYGYAQPTNGTIKCLMVHPFLLGPQWLFLNEQNKPAIIVDANTGEVSGGGIILDLLGYLF